MRKILSRVILVVFDVLAIFISISIAYLVESYLFEEHSRYVEYIDKLLIYLIIVAVLFYEGIYTKRYDFWHESRLVIKSLGLSFLLVMSYLAITKNVEQFSNIVIVLAFVLMAFFIPLFKNILKKSLFRFGLWRREAKVYGEDEFVENEIFKNIYLGYVSAEDKEAKTIFINSQDLEEDELKKIIDREMRLRHEVIFIPLVNEYNMIHSDIYELSNTRTNLVVFKNRLRSKLRVMFQQVFNYGLAIALLPILLPVIGILSFLIKKESPGPVFFAHNRIGKDGKIVPTLKFRSMFVDAKERLEKLLEDEEIREEWEKNFKLKEDPRVTKIGSIMRKTSLDELPQIFNVLKGEMNFVGPRPVIQKEIDQYYKEDAEYYFMVKPGITGLWQVSGRSDTDYDFRVSTDKWYVRNWSLWLDIVILFKTVKVVLFREGAY
ncbi:MAG: sugar transferase [Campylobacterota bacterium]|nr:sugar transferase [Campylobacterota bacterium]